MDKNKLIKLKEQAEGEAVSAESLDEIEKLRVHYLGKKGAITSLVRELSQLPPEERPEAGAAVNAAKNEVEKAFTAKREAITERELTEKLEKEPFDISPTRKGFWRRLSSPCHDGDGGANRHLYRPRFRCRGGAGSGDGRV